MDYEKLFKDKKDGKINDNMMIQMDNDDGSWICLDQNLSDEELEVIENAYEERYGRPKGHYDVVDILNAAGINADWC